jgi:hypothetical protein
MLMLYQFKLEVLNLRLQYSCSTNCSVIADTRDDRGSLIRRQFGEHNGRSVKRSVLLGARALTYAEVELLRRTRGTSDSVWLATRVHPAGDVHGLRHLPRLKSEAELHELLESDPEGYDTLPLTADQYIHGQSFSHEASGAESLLAAA